jgi:hypothetical protein
LLKQTLAKTSASEIKLTQLFIPMANTEEFVYHHFMNTFNITFQSQIVCEHYEQDFITLYAPSASPCFADG